MLDMEEGPGGLWLGAITPLPALWGHRDIWRRGDPQLGRPRDAFEPLLCPEDRAALVTCQTTPVLLRVSLFSFLFRKAP